MHRFHSHLLAGALALCALPAAAAPVINEIMFHPPGAVDDLADEWIELYNNTGSTQNLTGWRITKGVDYAFGAVSIAPGGYLIVAANVAAFQTAHPGFAGQVVGGWTGRLSNSGEKIRLEDAAGEAVDEVDYADEGDWALRARAAASEGRQGWDWVCPADGDGYTLELRNPTLSAYNSGQNWGVSSALGGTPGAANSVASANIAPLIIEARHKPAIPSSTDPIVIACTLRDEEANATATLHWRLDGGTWATRPMVDTNADGEVEATISPQADLAIIEWYIEATDGPRTRTWPAATRMSNPGVSPQTFAQSTNALLQVDNSFDPNATFRTAAENPIYRLIIPAAERAELLQIQTTYTNKPVGEEDSVATFNMTFISYDGEGLKTNYRCGVRNRGQGSALGPPNNYHVNFTDDNLWNKRSSIALNCRYGYSQALGQALAARAGIATQDAAIVKVRVNGADLAQAGNIMFGRYVRLEGRDAAMVERHFPNDPDGNFYRLDDHAPDPVGMPTGNLGSGEFQYEGTNPAAYSDTFIKETNKAANNFTDLINLCRIISAPATGGTAAQPAITDANYPAAVATVFDTDNFYRYFAMDALIGNQEGGLQTGRCDDASMYAGVIDQRFRFIPHDYDDVFDIGNEAGNPITRSIFNYDGDTSPGTGMVGLTRMFRHPQLVPKYYSAVLDALNTWFNHATIDPMVDEIMAGWVPATDGSPAAPNRGISEIKNFVTTRTTNILNQIQQNYSLVTTVGGTTTPEGYRRTVDGSATFSGTFNVAKTYSVTVNGQLATWNYRTISSSGVTAGTWSMVVPVGGGTVLHPGLNRVVVQFWDAINGTGNVLNTQAVDVLYQPASASYTNVSGTLQAGSLRLIAPATYIPGKPFLVRVDQLDTLGNLDRTAWDTTVTLSANGAGVTLPTVQLYNGMGSTLITIGDVPSGPTVTLIPRGGTRLAPNASAPDWRILDSGPEQLSEWRTSLTFDDSTWKLGKLEAGVGDNDERTTLVNIATRTTFYFRKVFTVADPTVFASLVIKAVVDDGAVFYINGTAVQVDNIVSNPSFTTPATQARSGTAETMIRTFDISAFLNVLTSGDNLLAVEVHNATGNSDLSFDCELTATPPTNNPGNFILSAQAASFSASKAMTSLGTPTITTASGTLATGATNWSGVVQVTDNIIVPVGGTLNIAAGTHVLIDGDPVVGGHAGKNIVVNGALNINGTLAAPVNITATGAADRWGQLTLSSAQPSTVNYALVSHAGRGTNSSGHTSRCAMINLNTSTLTLNDSVFGDGPGKALLSSGNCTLTLQRSLLNRTVTGPELNDNCGLLCEDSNIQLVLPNYREDDPNTGTNEAAPDDEDCMYVHNGTSRSVIMRRSVFARCGDDVFDCLGGPITVEDSILREGWDKGLSLLNNNLTISNTLIVRCDKAIVPKSQNADVKTVTATNCTIISENHDTSQAPWGYPIPPSDADPDTPSTGFYTQNKSGQSNVAATLVINAKNCIVQAQSPVLIDAPYSAANTVVTYSDLTLLDNSTFTWPGTGNISANPLFTDAATGNYRITSTSPCRDTGDPTTFDPDTTRADMGALRYIGTVAPTSLTWTPAGGPYRLTANTNVPVGTTLTIMPGAAVYFDQNVRLTVRGKLLAQGTAGNRITFSHVPGTVAAGDCDPIKIGTQTGPPKWGGIRIIDSLAQENVVAYCDFVNAQGTSPIDTLETDQENWGSLGVIRSWAWVDNCTWAGSHLRWCYGRCAKLTVTRCNFGDMFDATEAPPADFVSGADNKQEPLKVEYKDTDTAVVGNPLFNAGFPVGGWFRVYYNDFHGNKGHNDVFDGDGGRVGTTFALDCRYNYFHGLTGDEHMDLKGDALIANNIIEHGTKDQYTSDTGYSNAISTDGAGAGTTNMVARNLVFDMDHLMNCKAQVAAFVEHNTIANMHADFHYSAGAPFFIEQDVKCSVVNMLVPNDGATPGRGDGCYLGFNIISGVPRLISDADTRQTATNTFVHDVTTKIEFNRNICDQITDTSIGINHPGTIFASAFGTNTQAAPLFVDSANKNYSLKAESPARGAGPFGLDAGWGIPEWAYIDGGPIGTTPSTSAAFTVGGPGLIAYKWRLDGGAWSAPVTIGTGAVFDRTNPTVRTGTISLSSLTNGPHTLEVLGMDFAGNWQDADPAKTYTGQSQFAPTARTWTVDTTLIPIRLSEILAESATVPDTIEVQNLSGSPVNLSGWYLSDDPLVPKIVLSGTIPAGGYATFSSIVLGLDKDGDTVYLLQGGTVRDSVTFGQQIADFTIGRNAYGTWTLCTPTLGAANTPVPIANGSSVRINEWMASTRASYDDGWIELMNTSNTPALLTGLHLTNNRAGNANAYIFPALSFIPANGYVRLIASGEITPGHLPFELDPEYEILSLLAADSTVQDSVMFYPQTTDWSMGRDAGGALTYYELPTRGFTNEPGSGYTNALALLRGLRVTEIMFNAIGGSDFDYIELKNVGSSTIDLTGVKLVKGIDFTFVGVVLLPGEYVIVCKSVSRFRARYGNGPRVAGAYNGQLDNGGEGVSLQMPPPYDANILNFDYEDAWFPLTDGFGPSLVISNPLAKTYLWGTKDTWAASTTSGGDPAGTLALSTTYTGWSALHGAVTVVDDGDHDGVSALVEYALGMNPESANGGDGQGGAPLIIRGPNNRTALNFLVPENSLALQGHGLAEATYRVQASSDLANWTTISTKTVTTAWTGAAGVTIGASSGGFVPVTVEDTVTPGTQPGRYLRLQITYTP